MIQHFWRATLVALVLTLPLAGQVTVAQMIQMHEAKPGRLVKGQIAVTNPTSAVVAFRIFPTHSKATRSATKWLTFNEEYVNIQPHSTIRIGYRMRTPKNVVGSYHASYVVQPIARKKIGMLRVRIRYAGTIVITAPGGVSNVEFEDCTYRNNNLHATLKNTGTIAYITKLSFYVGERQYVATRRLLLPGQSVKFATTAIGITGRVVLFADCGGGTAFGTMWTIRDMVVMRDLVTIVPVHLRLSTEFGPGGNRLLAGASTTLGKFNLGASSFFQNREDRLSFRLGYRARRWNAYVHTYDGHINLTGTLHVKRWWVMLSAQPQQEWGQLNVRYRFDQGLLGMRTSVVQGALNWAVTASIPLTLNLKFRRRVLPRPTKLNTFKVR